MELKERVSKKEATIRQSIGKQFDPSMGELIVPLFYSDSEKFNPGNRLSGLGELLRQFAIDDLMHWVFTERSEPSFSWFDDEGETECLSRTLLLHEDYRIATITHSYLQHNALAVDVYTLVVYKNRGQIECFLKNKQPVEQKECYALLETIERSGYSFDEKIALFR